jgi:cephalosporin-C deacetylase-like acetyl esterase
MSIFGDIVAAFKRDRVSEFTAITKELKDLREYWKQRYDERERRMVELETELERMRTDEGKYHEQLIALHQAYRDVKEELLFLKRMKQ